jgi:hypothetical protein
LEYRTINIAANKSSQEKSDCKVKKLKRRYKEFVQLQKNLEESSQFKPFLKHIKCPSKYLNLPIGNMDGEYVEKRRRRLNEYLNVTTLFSISIHQLASGWLDIMSFVFDKK